MSQAAELLNLDCSEARSGSVDEICKSDSRVRALQPSTSRRAARAE